MSKDIIEKFCAEYASLTNQKVEYFSGKKPSSYYVPQFVTTKQAISGAADNVILDWFEEVFVNDRCIFRESRIPIADNWTDAEEVTRLRLMSSIFNCGVQSAKKILEDFDKKRGHE